VDLYPYLDHLAARLTASAREHAIPPAARAVRAGVTAGIALGVVLVVMLISIGFLLGKVVS
jgi:hypothetical protein